MRPRRRSQCVVAELQGRRRLDGVGFCAARALSVWFELASTQLTHQPHRGMGQG